MCMHVDDYKQHRPREGGAFTEPLRLAEEVVVAIGAVVAVIAVVVAVITSRPIEQGI